MSSQKPVDISVYDALILAGGKGSRMGHQDKGWVVWQGRPFIHHMLDILKTQQPAPRTIYISANRNQEQYAQIGYEVITDERASFQGPLAGIEQALKYLQNLQHQPNSTGMPLLAEPCETPLLVVPCDTMLLPAHLFALLNEGLDEMVDATYATSSNGAHPLCCLVKPKVLDQLTHQLNNHERRVMSWLTLIHAKSINFESDTYFKNFNDLESLLNDAHD